MPSYGSLSPAVFPVFFNCKLIQPGTIVCSIYTEIRYSGTPFLAATILTLLTKKKKNCSNLLFLSPSSSLLHTKGKGDSQSFIRSSFVLPPSPIHTLGMKERNKGINQSVLSFLHLNQVQVNHMCKCVFYCSVEKCTVKHNLIFGTLFHLLARNILLNVKTITKYLAQAVAKVTWAKRQSNTVYVQ